MIDKTKKKMTILDVAQSLFARFGLSKTTIDDIAKKASMGKASIYYYFTNKEAIFKEVINKEGRQFQEKILKEVNSETSPQSKIRIYIITRMELLKNLSNYYSMLRDDYLRHYSFVEKARHSYDVFETTLLSSILQEGVQNRVFDVQNVTLTAETILVALKGLELKWTTDMPLMEIEQNADSLLRILFKGIEIRN